MSSMSLCAYPDSNIYTIMILQLWSCRRTGSPINPMDDLSLYFFVVLHRDPKKPVPPTFHPLPPPQILLPSSLSTNKIYWVKPSDKPEEY